MVLRSERNVLKVLAQYVCSILIDVHTLSFIRHTVKLKLCLSLIKSALLCYFLDHEVLKSRMPLLAVPYKGFPYKT